MQARSALFDLYGDHLRPRGGRAPVSALVRLLEPLGVAAPAVRTAISRMVRQGWLDPARLPGGPGYQLTPRGLRRLDEAATRIYRTPRPPWDGSFDLIVLTLPARRSDRARVASTLAYLGYGRLDPATWVSPRPADEVDTVLREVCAGFERFTATHAAGSPGAAALVRRAWDLAALADAYRQFMAEQGAEMTAVADDGTDGGTDDGVGGGVGDDVAYAARFRLVHAWRAFLFRDPQLPWALLPQPWAGADAASFFDHHASRLRPAADRFVDCCLSA